MAFAEVVGHERVKALVGRALEQGRLPPALLLSGPEGVGKRTFALAVVRALLCDRAPQACGACNVCQRVVRGIHPDVVVVEPATAAIKIEQVRDVAREIGARPFEARARAFVIDDAHLMTEQAMNALLKSLEEPASTSHVMLVTASPQGLLPTIRSRCQELRFGPLPAAVIEGHLVSAHGLKPEEARLRAVLSGGSLAAALTFEAEAYRTLREEILGILEGSGQGSLWRMEAAERLAEVEDLQAALLILRSLLRDVAALRGGAADESLFNADAAPRLRVVAQGPLAGRAVGLAEAVEETRLAVKGNASKLLSMDALVDRLAV